MKLRERAPKHNVSGPHREISASETLQRITPYLRTFGITRVADITWLDRVGIPVYNAIIPRSNDILSVYNGKGVTAADARASAVMEAAERFCAWQPRPPEVIASYAEMAARGRAVMDPEAYNLEPNKRYHRDLPISWVRGFDLASGDSVYIPLCLAGYYTRFHEAPCYRISTANGIASGNSLEEAVCHALCEVIERDDWTMAELISNRLKRVIKQKMSHAAPPGTPIWLEDLHPVIDVATLPPWLQRYAEMFEKAGTRLVLRNITSPTGIPSVAAMVSEDVADTFAGAHGGYAAHPDAEVAVMRALAEVAQSRAVDIQGMREDLSLPDEKVNSWNAHAHRSADINLSEWPFGECGNPVSFADLPSHPSDDIVADIRLMVDKLRARGLSRVIVVDLSVPGLPVRVARVIVPEMESWGLDQSKLGRRAAERWDAVLKTMIARRDRHLADQRQPHEQKER